MRTEALAFDAHYPPDEGIYSELREVIRSADVQYVTTEYYRDTDGLVLSLQYLQNMQHELS